MRRIIVIITALLSIGITSCSNNSNSRYFPEVRVHEFEYDGRTYLIFEKGGYKMGVVEKHETESSFLN